MKNMKNYIKGSTGVKIPKAIYGTAWKEERTSELVELALESGFRGIDTACQPRHYKEDLVGLGIKKAYDKGIVREDLFLQTKFTSPGGQDPSSIPYDPRIPLEEQILASFEVSRKNLDTNYLDSLILHSPMENLEKTYIAWKTLESLFDKGEVKQIGISNCYDINLFKTLFENAKIKPSLLQNRFYNESHYDNELRKFCNENNVYYQCFWTLRANTHIVENPIVEKIANELNKTNAQIFFRCLNQQGIFPLYGTTSKQHMQEDLDLDSFNLTDQQCDLIKEAGPYQ